MPLSRLKSARTFPSMRVLRKGVLVRREPENPRYLRGTGYFQDSWLAAKQKKLIDVAVLSPEGDSYLFVSSVFCRRRNETIKGSLSVSYPFSPGAFPVLGQRSYVDYPSHLH